MFVRRIEALDKKAEGYIHGTPYTTELCGPDGCTVHFWMGHDPTYARAKHLAMQMCNYIDVVGATFSGGSPSGFWQHKEVSDPNG